MTVACTLNAVRPSFQLRLAVPLFAQSFPSNETFWTQEATDVFNSIVKGRIVEVHFQQGIGPQW